MQTVTETPAEWLLRAFESALEDYQRGAVHWSGLGLAICQEMITLKDDMETHGYPRCWACGWTGEGKEPDYDPSSHPLSPFAYLATQTAPFRTLMYPAANANAYIRSGGTPGRYLQAGLPPV